MARKEEGTTAFTIRIPLRLAKALARYQERRERESLVRIGRNGAVRELMAKALAEELGRLSALAKAKGER